jgi:hypothetical protein
MANETKPQTVLEVDASTGVETIREITAEELAQIKVASDSEKAREAEATAKATARSSALAKLAELGLTEEEVAAL